MTPSQARNSIKKCLKAILDPKLKNNGKKKIWEYFNNQCAYCGKRLRQSSRTGHIDHLHPEMEGGSNRLSNLVLTCSICNGDEKREKKWDEFLRIKCGDDDHLYRKRSGRIVRWIAMNAGQPLLSDEELNLLKEEFEKIDEIFSDSVERLRALK